MKRFLTRLSIFLAIVLVIYNLWSELGRAEEKKTGCNKTPVMKTRFPEITIGADSGKGNIIGIQPYFTPQAYATALNFKITLTLYLQQLQKEKLLSPKTILVFPEYTGSWLVAVNEKQDIYDDSSLHCAMKTIIRSNLFKFGFHYLQAPKETDKTSFALFCMKRKKMAEIYQDVFGELAKTFGVTIVAGSVILPGPSLAKNGKLITGSNILYNTVAVFDTGGNILLPLIRQPYPLAAGLTGSGDKSVSPLFSTPAGKLAILPGAASGNPDAYSRFAGQADIIAIPSLGGSGSILLSGREKDNSPGVKRNRFENINESEPGGAMRLNAVKAGIHNGMNVFSSGDIWDLRPDGRVLALKNDSLLSFAASPGRGRMVNLWLP
jgi:hypothetical protein